jgi:hypothetical protein
MPAFKERAAGEVTRIRGRMRSISLVHSVKATTSEEVLLGLLLYLL